MRLQFSILRLIAGLALALLAVTVSPPAFAGSDSSGAVLRLEVVNLRNDHGQVGCSLFNDPTGFPRHGNVFRHVWAPIHGDRAVCEFPGIPAGTYAAAVFHDENSDGKFNTNMFGMPLEGYGFSNDAPVRFGPPSFEAASFRYEGKTASDPIHIRY